jgi:hypothetical protein
MLLSAFHCFCGYRIINQPQSKIRMYWYDCTHLRNYSYCVGNVIRCLSVKMGSYENFTILCTMHVASGCAFTLYCDCICFILYSVGLQNLYTIVKYCLNRVHCRRSLIATSFEEQWKPEDCNNSCDVCRRLSGSSGNLAPGSGTHSYTIDDVSGH